LLLAVAKFETDEQEEVIKILWDFNIAIVVRLYFFRHSQEFVILIWFFSLSTPLMNDYAKKKKMIIKV
jgi:hypothetical protein